MSSHHFSIVTRIMSILEVKIVGKDTIYCSCASITVLYCVVYARSSIPMLRKYLSIIFFYYFFLEVETILSYAKLSCAIVEFCRFFNRE